MEIGTDIIEIERIRSIAQRHESFIDKILTPAEKAYCLKYKDPMPSLAGRFAAKEAVLKAAGTGLSGVSWQDIEILPSETGCPHVQIFGQLEQILQKKGIQHIKVSISHSRDYAVAVAIGEGMPNEDYHRL